MEVHHPHHVTHKKKWTEYLLEFIMLFLAVFLGFLAEYYLEHKIEHNRENQFMISLVEDLTVDTTELKRGIYQVERTRKYSDSALSFLASYKPSTEIPIHFANHLIIAQQRLSLINTDRTSLQLKNAGGMRLIRNKKVANTILAYWKKIEETHNSLERYLTIRDAGRMLTFKLYRLPIAYSDSIHLTDRSSVAVIDQDPKKWSELANLVAISRQIARGEHSANLHSQYEVAIMLIAIIRDEYHL